MTQRMSKLTLWGLVATLLACFILQAPALAVGPGEVMSNPKLEARARAISQKLRCVVCQNQSIDDSNAPLAKDLRLLVRERLTAGDSNDQAISFIVARYGNFVLLQPPFQLNTVMLWFGPAILLLCALFVLVPYLRANASRGLKPRTHDALNSDEQARLKQLLDDGEPT